MRRTRVACTSLAGMNQIVNDSRHDGCRRDCAVDGADRAFTCPNCQALYQVVKVEAGPETDNRELTCRVCGGPLAGREGKFVLKYFLLREATRPKRGTAKAN